MPSVDQVVDDVRSDEAASTRDDDPHDAEKGTGGGPESRGRCRYLLRVTNTAGAPQAPDQRVHRRIAVVPAYNEEPTVAEVLERLHPLVDELVIVDDGSIDNTRCRDHPLASGS